MTVGRYRYLFSQLVRRELRLVDLGGSWEPLTITSPSAK
jgi:hypothetical protein